MVPIKGTKELIYFLSIWSVWGVMTITNSCEEIVRMLLMLSHGQTGLFHKQELGL